MWPSVPSAGAGGERPRLIGCQPLPSPSMLLSDAPSGSPCVQTTCPVLVASPMLCHFCCGSFCITRLPGDPGELRASERWEWNVTLAVRDLPRVARV